MQKYIKQFVATLVAILIAPIVFTGFLSATVFGSLLIGWSWATDLFETLAEWVSND